MDTEMKTTNTKRIDKAMLQMKDLVSQKVSFPYTEWSHIYMFEDANPYSAAQTNSEGLTRQYTESNPKTSVFVEVSGRIKEVPAAGAH